MMINFKELTTGQYWSKFAKSDFWFGIDRLQMHNVDYAILTLGAVLTLGGMGLMVFAKSKPNPHTKELVKRYAKPALFVGILELIWFPLRWQNTVYLGTHFIAALIFGIGALWALWVLKHHLTKHNSNIEQWSKELQKKKYLEMPSK